MPGSEELLREALKPFAFPRATSRRPDGRHSPENDTMTIEVRAGDWIRACVAMGTMDRDSLEALPEYARPSLEFVNKVCPR